MDQNEVEKFKRKVEEIKNFGIKKYNAIIDKQTKEKIENIYKNSTPTESLLHYIDMVVKTAEDDKKAAALEFTTFVDNIFADYQSCTVNKPKEKTIPLTKK